MGKQIFREKSMKRISSPEQVDDYLRVTGTGAWIIIAAVCLLAVAVFLWIYIDYRVISCG